MIADIHIDHRVVQKKESKLHRKRIWFRVTVESQSGGRFVCVCVSCQWRPWTSKPPCCHWLEPTNCMYNWLHYKFGVKLHQKSFAWTNSNTLWWLWSPSAALVWAHITWPSAGVLFTPIPLWSQHPSLGVQQKWNHPRPSLNLPPEHPAPLVSSPAALSVQENTTNMQKYPISPCSFVKYR